MAARRADTASACGPDRPRTCSVRYLPLGSPWLRLNWLSALLHGRRTACSRCGWVPGWVPGGWYTGVYREGGIPGTTQRLHIGIARAQPLLDRRFCAHPWHSRPCWALRTPWAPRTQIALLGPIWARFRVLYPKVSHIPGVSTVLCHEACHTPYFKNRL